VDVKTIASPVVLWIVRRCHPPVVLAVIPFTFRPPTDPVLFSTIPVTGPLATVPAEVLRNSRLFEPMLVPETLSAVPVVVALLLTRAPVAPGLNGFSSHTATVPPPLAEKLVFVPVLSVMPPENVIVSVLLVAETPAPDVTFSEPA
jgi:hypothetical protein